MNLDRMRAGQLKRFGGLDKAEPPVDGLLHSCGHPVIVKNLTSRLCHKCVEEVRLRNKERRKRNRAAQRDARTIAVPAQKPDDPTKRLPDGSHFALEFYAPSQTWTGKLTVPGMQPFEVGGVSNVFKMLKLLDEEYRKTLAPALPVSVPGVE